MSKPGRVIGPEEESLSFNGSTSNGVLTYGGANQIDVESNFTYDGATATLNGQLDINGNSYVRWTNGGGHIVRVNNGNATANTTIQFPDASGNIALTTTARSLVKLKGDDFYLASTSSVNRWYHVAMYGQSISTSGLNGLAVADSTAIRMCGFIATQNCIVHKISVAWYQTVTADLEWEVVKVPIVHNSTSNVTLATMTATDCDGSYTANTNYMKIFTVSGGNTLTAGQGLTLCVRRTSGSSSTLYGWANAEIEITS